MKQTHTRTVWIDLDNSPHVLFFAPIIERLKAEDVEVLITVRSYAQVVDLANMFGLSYHTIGTHYGGSKLMKVAGLIIRSIKLFPLVLKHRPQLAISHGSRSQLLLAWLLRIPSILAMDYEFTQAFVKPSLILAPEALKNAGLEKRFKSVDYYPGIKENVYIQNPPKGDGILQSLNLDDKRLIVSVRPPATTAHYFVEKSRKLFEKTMSYLATQPNVQVVILPRTKVQGNDIRKEFEDYFTQGLMTIPEQTVHALDLIWVSDLIISGGGTMNREAAVLGVPVYSIYAGKLGAVDAFLEENGRLTFLRDESDIREKLNLEKRDHDPNNLDTKTTTLNYITTSILKRLPC